MSQVTKNRSKKTATATQDPIVDRIESIEGILSKILEQSSAQVKFGDANSHRMCSLPQVPEQSFADTVSQDRQRLIVRSNKIWANGTNLRYFLFQDGAWGGSRRNIEHMREAFEIWQDVGIGLTFEEVDHISEAEIRVGFLPGDGSWSYVGRHALHRPGQTERSMNIGWELDDDYRGVYVAVHEVGHAMGFPHEHQNPYTGIIWDEQKVLEYFAGPPNYWPEDVTRYNILRKLTSSETEGSNWDPDSVMHYGFPAGLIIEPEEYRDGLEPEIGLSETDIAQVKKFYPPLAKKDYRSLKPFDAAPVTLAPDEQQNFILTPSATRTYTFQTFGEADLVMVLFDNSGSKPRFVAGIDNSGTEAEASMQVRLQAGCEYCLRVRMYLNYGSEKVAIMFW